MKYKIGLVVGKFCPLHLGHEYVINTALTQSERVVIISYTSEKYYPAAHRRLWLSDRFGDRAIILVPEAGFPVDDAPAIEHREYCYQLLKSFGLSPDAVFGSEDYIPGFAAYLFADPVVVDIDRLRHPVSGTDIREKRVSLSDWVDPMVARVPAKRVLLIGGESSGKSTLAKALVQARPAWGMVEEFGRTYGEASEGLYTFPAMLHIAKVQVREEENHMLYFQNSVIVCDTSPLVTKFYSQKWFGLVDPMLDVLAQRTYDYVFLCQRDFEYEDGFGRNGDAFSREQETFYRKKLRQPWIDLYGPVTDRVKQVLKVVK
jgi:NadR type nicotinamide-nucleotide adenylyltransferase